MRDGRRRALEARALVAVALVAGACDSGGGATTGATAHRAFCDASVATSAAALEHDLAQVGAGMLAMADASPDPAFAEVVREAAGLLADDPEAAFESEAMARTAVLHDDLIAAHCGAQPVELRGTDFAFSGDELVPAGRALLTFTNASGDHHHEAMVARRTDDGSLPIEDVLALGPEGAMAHLEIVGVADAGPEATDRTLVDLVPGTYVYICPVPLDEDDPDAPMHVQLGMFREFEVVA